MAAICDYCKEPIEENPIKFGSKMYCSDACAFEATRSADCSGRTDSSSAPSVITHRAPGSAIDQENS